MTGRAGALLAVLALAACAGQPGPACTGAEVGHAPLIPAGRYSVVPVRLNGQARSLVVDTGSNVTMITSAAADELGVTRLAGRAAAIHAVGGEVRPELGRFGDFDLDGLQLGKMVVAIAPFPTAVYPPLPVAGLLGEPLLLYFDVELDFAAQRLTFHEPGRCARLEPGWPGEVARIDLAATPLKEGRVVGPVEVNGHTVEATFDSGAPVSLITPETAERLGLSRQDGAPVIRVQGVDGQTGEGYGRRVDEIRVGGLRWRDVPVVVAPAALGTSDMLFGHNLMLGHRLYISRRSEALFIQAAPKPDARPAS